MHGIIQIDENKDSVEDRSYKQPISHQLRYSQMHRPPPSHQSPPRSLPRSPPRSTKHKSSKHRPYVSRRQHLDTNVPPQQSTISRTQSSLQRYHQKTSHRAPYNTQETPSQQPRAHNPHFYQARRSRLHQPYDSASKSYQITPKVSNKPRRVKGCAEEKAQNKYEHGTEKELKYDGSDKDRFRKRKLRYRKYTNIILSKQPDCIMGYTDDDGIKRAQMPCGCSIASDTMWRYLKSTFEKDMKAVNVYCPVPKDKCKGTDAERLWDLKLVFIVSDLSRNEINRYSKVINNRKSGSKSCPQCGCVTERPPNLRIWRVRCTQCHKADWCWHCLQIWKGSGYGAICGNDGCLGEKLNLVLSQKTYIDPKKSGWVKTGEKMPDMRACPKCLTLIEFTEACQHMTCLGCPHEFCFKCLQTWRDSSGTHIHKSKLCIIHKIQQFK